MFSEKLEKLMKERGLSQRKLGEAAGIPPTTISGWLNAGRLPDYNALKKLISFFRISADYFFKE